MTRRFETLTGSMAGGLRAAFVLAAVLLLGVAVALPADAQARRTRPPENQGTSSGGGTASSPPPSRPSPPPATASSGSSRSGASATQGRRTANRRPAVRTRPGSSGSPPQVIENDRRVYRYGGKDRPYPGRYGSGHYGSGYYSPYRGYYWGWSPYSRYSYHLGYWGWYYWPDPYPYGPYPHSYYDYHGRYYAPYRVPYYASQVRDSMGALDLDLKPGNTQIYLDGQFIGTADDFDGWPQYLWLEKGDYHFVFYAEGRRTIAREYKILPSVVIDVEDRLETGESTPPEELFPVPTERRDERLRRNAELRERAQARGDGETDWRARSGRIRSNADGEAAADFASLVLDIEPADASIYLDGEFLGTAADLARLARGLTVDPGEHELSVVRPGYEPAEIVFTVDPGESTDLAVRLDPN